MKALIAAGGRATRLRPITHSINKHLIPLANRPMLEYAIEKIAECGIKEIAININPGDLEISSVIGDGSRWGVDITYLEQTSGPKGIAHAVANASAWIGDDSFLFYLGDNIILNSITSLVERFEKEKLDCLLCLSRVKDPQRFGVPEMKDGKIVRILEKPEHPPSDFAVTGIYLYRSPMLTAVKSIAPSARGEYEISDAHTWLIENGYRVGYQEITGWWKDTGKPEDLIEGNSLLLDLIPASSIASDAIIEQGAMIDGIVTIGSGTYVDSGSVIRGPVCIGKNCSIKQSTIHPHVSIDDGASLHDIVVGSSIIMSDATLECGPRIGSSIIGRNVSASAKKEPGQLHHFFMLGDGTVIEW
jgi:glucose-1-phosphate thymidylyltransferase